MPPETSSETPLPRNNGAKTRRVDLGLALLSTKAPRGVRFTSPEIAAWCDCTPAMIAAIEAQALRRLYRQVRARFNLPHASRAEIRRWMTLNFCS
ncbi:MAG TPA: hypothetical protein VGO59_07160 [Verrucomicrobiae bacterium]|jgi:hypothetical protein